MDVANIGLLAGAVVAVVAVAVGYAALRRRLRGGAQTLLDVSLACLVLASLVLVWTALRV